MIRENCHPSKGSKRLICILTTPPPGAGVVRASSRTDRPAPALAVRDPEIVSTVDVISRTRRTACSDRPCNPGLGPRQSSARAQAQSSSHCAGLTAFARDASAVVPEHRQVEARSRACVHCKRDVASSRHGESVKVEGVECPRKQPSSVRLAVAQRQPRRGVVRPGLGRLEAISLRASALGSRANEQGVSPATIGAWRKHDISPTLEPADRAALRERGRVGAVDGQRDALSARRHEVDPKRSPGRNDHGPSAIGVAERIDRGTNAGGWNPRARRLCRYRAQRHRAGNFLDRLGLLRNEDEVRGVLLLRGRRDRPSSAIGCAACDERKLGALLAVDRHDSVEVVLRVEDHRDRLLCRRFEPVPHALATDRQAYGSRASWLASAVVPVTVAGSDPSGRAFARLSFGGDAANAFAGAGQHA